MNLFLSNKYTKWYLSIIENRKNNPFDGYTEEHHIIPKSIGGSDESSNLVRLRAKEHYLCHLLLTKMVTGKALYSAKNAVLCMSNLKNRWHQDRVVKTGKAFEVAKSGLQFSEEHKRKISDAAKRHWKNPEMRAKASKAALNRPPVSDSTKQKMKESSAKRELSLELRESFRTANKNLTDEKREKFRTATRIWSGKNHSEESKKKMSKSLKGKGLGKIAFNDGLKTYYIQPNDPRALILTKGRLKL